MQPDPEYLRRHYSTLSDEALIEVDRADLVAVAQQLLDAEITHRGLTAEPHESTEADLDGEPSTPEDEPFGETDGPPDWLEEASEVFSSSFRGGSGPAGEFDLARDALRSAGIPCYTDTVDEDNGVQRCRLLVPGTLNMRAASLLDKEIFNADFESEWRGHLESMSDEELAEMNPRDVFCGLFDRVERVTRVYNQELARRKS